VIQVGLSFIIMVTNQFKLESLILELNYVDSIALPVMPTSQFLTLESGLILSYQNHEGTYTDDCFNCKMLMVVKYNTVWYQ